ncbi:hypothetical protein GFER_16130 [Geoalkalibacter ferrihydriticus DSM 17813]|uniref:Uncharacterized protein n=1 Tax=Geoalkalibacter ferrihydriticus DSM 17813 TaxID=1121915 RepID=A0A0C2HRT5_9BACT|nr:hypothetical protein GFER_16130 [Geoalkalibacter ferrihydriticus DSM 17813]
MPIFIQKTGELFVDGQKNIGAEIAHKCNGTCQSVAVEQVIRGHGDMVGQIARLRDRLAFGDDLDQSDASATAAPAADSGQGGGAKLGDDYGVFNAHRASKPVFFKLYVSKS